MEQSQLMSTPKEQNVDWERGRILRIYIGFQAIKCHCFLPQPPPPPPPPHFYCFSPNPNPNPNPNPTTTAATTFQLFSLHHHRRHHISIVFYPSPTRFIFFSPRNSIKDCQLPSLVHFVAMSRVVNNNRCFVQLLPDCPAYQRQFLLKTTTPQQLYALVQVLYNIPMGHITIHEENKPILLPYKDALLNLARANVPYKTKKRVASRGKPIVPIVFFQETTIHFIIYGGRHLISMEERIFT